MLLIKNRYYSDYGLDYVFEKLTEEFEARNKRLMQCVSPVFSYKTDCTYKFCFDKNNLDGQKGAFDSQAKLDNLDKNDLDGYIEAGNLDSFLEEQKAIVFWDKDVRLARALEHRGIRLLPNSADTLAACDDKELTYSRLVGCGIPLIKTVSSPLIFDVNSPLDGVFLDYLEEELKYPIVVKENVGSQGKQVYLATNRTELQKLNGQLMHKQHIYQEFRGEFGCDIRVYVLGGEAVASVSRKNTTSFKSNVALGGDMNAYPLDDKLRELAVTVAKQLNLCYGSVDFVYDNGYVFIEANSNAYFRGVEALGVKISKMLVDYILRSSNGQCE